MYPPQPPYVPPRQPSPAPVILGCGAMALVGFVLLIIFAAVSPESMTTAGPTVTVTVTRDRPSSVAATQRAVPSASPTKVKVVKVKVPNVVGRNHQEAQDYLQSLGFYGLAEEDSTGQGRVLLFDRNWQVVRQSPKAGTMADPETATITLFSKKIGE